MTPLHVNHENSSKKKTLGFCPPPPPGVITVRGLIRVSKIPKHHTRSLFPTHPHSCLHFGSSASFLKQSSFFSAFAFKWVSGVRFPVYGCQSFLPHRDTSDGLYPECHTLHPMDAMSFSALCPTMQWFQHRPSHAGRPPFSDH